MERRQSNLLLSGLFIFVFSFGLLTWAQLSKNSQIAEAQRQPSSIAQVHVQPPPLKKLSDELLLTFDLQCKKMLAKTNFEVKGNYVQLSGKNCLNLKKDIEVKIQNQTNGFEASYFDAGQGQYKTDLIQLSEGENQIHIEYKNSGGQKTELSLFVTSRRI